MEERRRYGSASKPNCFVLIRYIREANAVSAFVLKRKVNTNGHETGLLPAIALWQSLTVSCEPCRFGLKVTNVAHTYSAWTISETGPTRL